MQRSLACNLCSGKLPHAGKRGEIENSEFDTASRRFFSEPDDRRLTAASVAACEHDIRSLADKFERGMVADTTISSGDDVAAADLRRNVLRLPVFAHALSLSHVL